jgi:hypothetical protein
MIKCPYPYVCGLLVSRLKDEILNTHRAAVGYDLVVCVFGCV